MGRGRGSAHERSNLAWSREGMWHANRSNSHSGATVGRSAQMLRILGACDAPTNRIDRCHSVGEGNCSTGSWDGRTRGMAPSQISSLPSRNKVNQCSPNVKHDAKTSRLERLNLPGRGLTRSTTGIAELGRHDLHSL